MNEQPNLSPEEATAAAESPNGAPVAVDDREALLASVAKAEQERDEFKDLLLRTRADFENYQKRAARDLAQERRYAVGPLAADLLPALDNLERATEAAKQAGDTGPLVQGVVMVQAQVHDILRRHGISRLEAQGQPFDAHLHQAVMQMPSAEVPPGTVVQVLEQGYGIHERVLRPARVIVSTAAADNAAKSE
jgi:molecular chaperone GrpE